MGNIVIMTRKESDVISTQEPETSDDEIKYEFPALVEQRSFKDIQPKFLELPEITLRPRKQPETRAMKMIELKKLNCELPDLKTGALKAQQKIEMPKICLNPLPTSILTKKNSSNSCFERSSRLSNKKKMKPHLHNLEAILTCSNATPIGHKDSLGYRCSFCTLQYAKPADLKSHTLETHKYYDISKLTNYKFDVFRFNFDITALQCSICDSSVDGIEELILHLQDHGKEVFTDLRSHFIPFKFDKDTLYCVHCLQTFDHFRFINQHMSEHYRNYVCDTCEMPFVTEQNYRSHVRGHKKGEFKCKYCPKVFETSSKKKNHHNKDHLTDGKRHRCLSCNEKFKRYSHRQEHMIKVHGADRVSYKCGDCGRSFNTKQKLLYHTKRYHMMETFKCTECYMCFVDIKDLHIHRRRHNRKRYCCDECPKSFCRKYMLRAHIRQGKCRRSVENLDEK